MDMRAVLQIVGRSAHIMTFLLESNPACKQRLLDLTIRSQPVPSQSNVQPQTVSMLQLSIGWLARSVNGQQAGEEFVQR